MNWGLILLVAFILLSKHDVNVKWIVYIASIALAVAYDITPSVPWWVWTVQLVLIVIAQFVLLSVRRHSD